MNKCKHWKKDEISGLCPTCAFPSQKVQGTAITNWWSQTDVPRSWTTRPIRFPLILLLKDWVTGSLNRYTQFKELSLTYATYAIIILSHIITILSLWPECRTCVSTTVWPCLSHRLSEEVVWAASLMPCLPQKVWQSRFLAEFGISGIVCNSCIWWISALQSTFQYSCPTTLITFITSSNRSFCLEVIEAVRSVDGIGLFFGGWDTAAHWDIPMAEGSQHPAAGKYQCHWRHCDSVTRLNYTQLNAMVLRSWLLLLRRCFPGS